MGIDNTVDSDVKDTLWLPIQIACDKDYIKEIKDRLSKYKSLEIINQQSDPTRRSI